MLQKYLVTVQLFQKFLIYWWIHNFYYRYFWQNELGIFLQSFWFLYLKIVSIKQRNYTCNDDQWLSPFSELFNKTNYDHICLGNVIGMYQFIHTFSNISVINWTWDIKSFICIFIFILEYGNKNWSDNQCTF